MDGYKHYVRADANGIVVLGFTTGFPEIATPQSGDLELIGHETRQFQLELMSPPPRSQRIYKILSGAMTARTQSELDSEWSARPIPPDPDNELANAINASLTLDDLKKALIGTNGKLAKVIGKLK